MRQLFLSPAYKQKLIIIMGLSFVLSLVLELYTFGFPDGFFLRWLRTYFVIFYLFAVAALAIVPFVAFVFRKWLK